MLTAVVYDANGTETGYSSLVSADSRRRLAVRAEEQTVKAGDIVYVDVTIQGENGIVESNADTLLTCSVTGGISLMFGKKGKVPS